MTAQSRKELFDLLDCEQHDIQSQLQKDMDKSDKPDALRNLIVQEVLGIKAIETLKHYLLIEALFDKWE